MDKRYDHKKHERRVYQDWDLSGGFEPNEKGEPFCIIMPPPNANDPLHVGHAMFVTLEDIFIRFARMQGKAALWLPGTDHAGIETQFVFEKKPVQKDSTNAKNPSSKKSDKDNIAITGDDVASKIDSFFGIGKYNSIIYND